MKGIRFAIPIIWLKPQNYVDDCYLCAIHLKGINKKYQQTLFYLNLSFAIRPVPHSEQLPICLQCLASYDFDHSRRRFVTRRRHRRSRLFYWDVTSAILTSKTEWFTSWLEPPKVRQNCWLPNWKKTISLRIVPVLPFIRFSLKNSFLFFTKEKEVVYCIDVK